MFFYSVEPFSHIPEIYDDPMVANSLINWTQTEIDMKLI